MGVEKSDVIWMNGEYVAWDDAKLHVLSHVIHYGTSVFEGIRCYNTSEGPAIFRLEEHVTRLLRSCKIYRMDPKWSAAEFTTAIVETIQRISQLVMDHPAIGELDINPFLAFPEGGMAVDARVALAPEATPGIAVQGQKPPFTR